MQAPAEPDKVPMQARKPKVFGPFQEGLLAFFNNAPHMHLYKAVDSNNCSPSRSPIEETSRMPRTLVFDLDGTLTDSVPDIAAAVNRTLAARGLQTLSEPAVAAMVGDGLQPLIERAFTAVGSEPDVTAAHDYLADYESNVAGATRLYAGVAEALDELRADGWILAVCTNKPERAARLLLSALGIADRFSAVGGGDSFSAHKPDPVHLRGTIKAAGGNPERALMVGDHTNDVLAAAGCGVRAIFAGWGYGRPGMEVGAVAVADDLPGLVRLAGELLPA